MIRNFIKIVRMASWLLILFCLLGEKNRIMFMFAIKKLSFKKGDVSVMT